jgi:hypothetical protein
MWLMPVWKDPKDRPFPLSLADCSSLVCHSFSGLKRRCGYLWDGFR